MNDPSLIGIIILAVAIVVFVIVLIWAILRNALCLFLISCGLGIAGYALGDWRWYLGAGVVAILWVFALKRRRRRLLEKQFDIVVEGVPPPPKRKRSNKKPPEITPERMRDQCVKILGKKIANPALLDVEIKRIMNSAKFSDWTRAQSEVYFEDASPRQIGYLKALGYKGSIPKCLGDASFMIECMLVCKAYNEKLSASPASPAASQSPSDFKADYIALWNSATASGVLSKRDATELLKVVVSSPESATRQALVSALSDYLAANDPAEIPAQLFALSEAWLT